tara:strand:+ start:364 stop:1413 length:1050 start_codon:yes stop_codon:yes gene_type:complete
MSNNFVTGAIIGFGKMGLAHTAIINSFANSKIIAVCDDSKLINKGFNQFIKNINFYSNHLDMLKNEKIDFVFITTPPNTHIPLALDCLRYNKHFFIEKPLSINSKNAEPLLNKLNEENNLVSMVGYMMRFVPSFIKGKQIIEDKALGEIFNFNSTIYVSQLFKKGKGWRYDKKVSGGGVINSQAAHLVDLISWYFDYPNSINANLRNVYSGDNEDFGHITFNWKNKLFGSLDSSWSVYNYRMLETKIIINAEKGYLEINDDTVKLFLDKPSMNYKKGWTIIRKPEIEKEVSIDLGGSHYTRQDEYFINSIIQQKQVMNDVKNAYKIQKIIDAIYYSSKNNNTSVKIKYE